MDKQSHNPREMLKCRCCAWVTPRWNRRGQHGGGRLREHVMQAHEEAYVIGQQQAYRVTYDLTDDDACDDLACYDAYMVEAHRSMAGGDHAEILSARPL
jgi:hypothetical protein